MDGGGEGGGQGVVHRRHDVVAHQHGGLAAAGFHAGGEGQKVSGAERIQGTVVHGDARVGVHIVAVAGEVLQYAAHVVARHLCHHGGDALGGARCIQAAGAVIHEVGRVGGDVRHRGEIDVDTKGREQGVLFLRVRHQGLCAARGQELLGRAVLFPPQVGIGADAHHGAALLVHAQKQGDARVRRCGVLVGAESLDDSVGGLVRKVPAKEHIAAQMIGGDVLHGGFRRTADEEQLPHLFLRGEGGEQRVDLLSRQLLRRRLRRRGGGLFLDGSALLRF